jgi:hypothetical protein
MDRGHRLLILFTCSTERRPDRLGARDFAGAFHLWIADFHGLLIYRLRIRVLCSIT